MARNERRVARVELLLGERRADAEGGGVECGGIHRRARVFRSATARSSSLPPVLHRPEQDARTRPTAETSAVGAATVVSMRRSLVHAIAAAILVPSPATAQAPA